MQRKLRFPIFSTKRKTYLHYFVFRKKKINKTLYPNSENCSLRTYCNHL